MGCDGGSIPRRDEMVKVKKKAEKADPEIELAAKWRHCALSGEKLKKPIVACELGKLYNKECLLLALLDKSSLPEVAKHIRSLRDVVELCLVPNPSYKPIVAMAEASQSAEFVCPVSGLEMSGRHRFVYLRGCGCALSERTLKEVPSETCHSCGRGFSKEDVVLLNGSEEEVKKQREAMLEKRAQAKQAKLAKGKRKKETSSPESGPSTSSSSPEGDSPPAKKRAKTSEEQALPGPPPPSTVTNETTKASSSSNDTAKSKHPATVLPKGASKYSTPPQPPPAAGVGSKLGPGSTATSVVKKTSQELTTSFKAPASDPGAREAYKALFHSKDKQWPKEKTSHWVTFFPYH